ncbi:MAG TPA: chemotaxis protein CheB [Stellaceae bacterium]|nr:chemotaxis protein CheB [Stellaceae bacterium]
MARHDIVAIGASAGGFPALSELARRLPGDFPAALLVTIHLHAEASTALPDLIDRTGALRAAFATEGEEIVPGGIYIAPPDRHLLADGGRLLLRRGPRENGARPAIDPMFRSIAYGFGSRAIGVILTGRLNDGSSGLLAIKRRGGLAVVQDPRDAEYPDMPTGALAATPVDHLVPLGGMAALLARLVREPAGPSPAASEELRREVGIAAHRDSEMATTEWLGERSMLTCPECQGVLWEIKEGNLARYRCHVGHAYTLEALAEDQSVELDRALSSALRALGERVYVIRRLAEESRELQHDRTAERWEARARDYEQQAAVIRATLISRAENGVQREDRPLEADLKAAGVERKIRRS